MKRTISVLLFAITVVMVGCASPGGWAEALEPKLRCGMSVKEVEKLTQKTVIEMDSPRVWRTHMISSGNTDVWLIFREGKLESVQIAWAEKIMRLASYQRIDLCGQSLLNKEPPPAMIRMPDNKGSLNP